MDVNGWRVEDAGLELEEQPIEYRNGMESYAPQSSMPGLPKYSNIAMKYNAQQQIDWRERSR